MKNKKILLIIITFICLSVWILDFNIKHLNFKLIFAMSLSLVAFTYYGFKEEIEDFRRYIAFQTLLTILIAVCLSVLDEGSTLVDISQPIMYGIIFLCLINIYLNLKPSKEEMDPLLKFDLTERELMISRELLKLKTNKEIASKLFIAESTVKKHIQNIFRKLEVKNRQEFIQLIREE